VEEKVSHREKRWVFAWAILLAVITTIPYIMGFIGENENWLFSGFVYGVEDGNSYIAKMRLGASGAWLFRSPYTTQAQEGVLAFLPYILLGKLAVGREMHTQFIILFHLFRIVSIPFVVYATYQFVSLFLKEIYWRRWVTLLATVGGGVGWLLLILGEQNWLGSLPLAWISPEWFGYLSILGQPHLILARALLLSGLTFYLKSSQNVTYAWVAGLIFLGMGFVHSLSLVSAYFVIGLHVLVIWLRAFTTQTKPIAWRWTRAAIRALIGPAPILLYMVYRFTTDPFLRSWTEQNKILTPHPAHIFVAYGLILPFVILGIKPMIKRRRWSGLLPLLWLAALPLLAYAPHNLQRRLPEGMWVIVLTLGALGLQHLTKDHRRWRNIGGALLIAFSIPTSLLILAGGIGVTGQPAQPVYRPLEEVRAFEQIVAIDSTIPSVISSFDTGNALPAWTDAKVVIGHGPESINLRVNAAKVEAFYANRMEPEDAIAFLRSNNINTIFFGPSERKLGEFEPGNRPDYVLLYQSGDYMIYKVDLDD